MSREGLLHTESSVPPSHLVPSKEEMQLPCAFFTPDGERIEALQGHAAAVL